MALESKAKAVIMYGRPYEMKSEDTGEVRKGLTIEYYFFGENGEALKSVVDAGDGTLGIRRAKCSLDISLKEKLMYVPGVYDCDFAMDVGADGKPVMKMKDINYVGKAEIKLVDDAAAASGAKK